jgi:hypothetical protein
MRLDRLSVDDLHVCAVGEMENDPAAIELLNEMYMHVRAEYIAVFEGLRALREYVA